MKVAAYLDFQHNAIEAIETYKQVFGAEVLCEYFYDEDMTQDLSLVGKVFHAELKIGDLNLYVCDSGKALALPSMKFVVEIRDESEARACFARLVQDGKEISGFKKMPYGPTIAEAEDQFGIRWDVVIC